MNRPKAAMLGVMLLLCLDVIHCFPITGTPGVGIQDYTGGPITAHCQSKDDDLGTRTMQNNEVWDWRFKPNVFGSTLWWCNFWWNSQTACFSVWDINNAPQYDASINDWRVAQDGFSLYDPVKSVWNRFYSWGITCTGHDSDGEMGHVDGTNG
ncbi:unnamed protein product [Calypogeia fissa]